jgi:hypothetical protein
LLQIGVVDCAVFAAWQCGMHILGRQDSGRDIDQSDVSSQRARMLLTIMHQELFMSAGM